MRGRLGFATAALLGLALAFAAGLWLGRQSSSPETRSVAAVPAEPGALRDVYSPRILSDPAFVKAQRENAAALEDQCRRNGEFCDEARAARQWLAEAGVRD